MIKDKLKIPIFPLRAKPYIAVQSKKPDFIPSFPKKVSRNYDEWKKARSFSWPDIS